MKSLLRECYENAITSQDIDTNFAVLFGNFLHHDIKYLDDGDSLAQEIAELIIDNNLEDKL